MITTHIERINNAPNTNRKIARISQRPTFSSFELYLDYFPRRNILKLNNPQSTRTRERLHAWRSVDTTNANDMAKPNIWWDCVYFVAQTTATIGRFSYFPEIALVKMYRFFAIRVGIVVCWRVYLTSARNSSPAPTDGENVSIIAIVPHVDLCWNILILFLLK